MLQASHHDFCVRHYSEKKRLYREYKEAQADYESRGDPTSKRSIDAMEEIAQLGEKVVALRDKVNRRFFSRGTENNRGHIQQILRIKNEVDGLKTLIASQKPASTNGAADEGTTSATAAGRTEGQTVVYRSLLSPDIPISELNHLPKDDPVVTMRKSMDLIRDSQVDKIYKIFPPLNDSTNLILDPEQGTEREPDKGDLVLRNVFREFLVWTGDTDVLARASTTEKIDTFLRHSTTELEDYIKFFEAFNSGRYDTSHFLRDAICDYLLPQDVPCITILGGRVASEARHRRMGVDGWDLLYRYFSNNYTWQSLEQCSAGFEDLLLAKKLSSLHRYGGPGDEDPSWLHPEDDVSQECVMALLLGFVVQTKGFCDPRTPFTHGADRTVTEKQSRNYVAGRMSKNDPLAKKLIEELASRVVRFVLFVYDRETGESAAHTDDMDSTWIARARTACNQDQLVDATWEIGWSVTDILDDLQFFRSVRDRMMGRDYYEFIIIDRMDRPEFDLIERVADALMQLSGNLSRQDVIVKAVREVIPSAEQEGLLDAIFGGILPAARQSANAHRFEYEGNRLRAWDIQRNHPNIIEHHRDTYSWDSREASVLSGILASMEAAGVIYKAARFETPQAIPKLMMAMDGHEDLYFDYSSFFGGNDELGAWLGNLTADNTTNNLFCNATLNLDGDGLRRFAEAFKSANPEAVFMKGMINPHYCAWPSPHMDDIPEFANLNFYTPYGHLYKWKHLPFDFPLALQSWQFLLHCEINCKLPFVRATQTTFVICASTMAEAETNAARLLAIADKMGWRLSFPMAHRWTSELGLLDVEVLWRGIQPLAAHAR